MEHINLVDLDFNSFNDDEKRIAFIVMYAILKYYHENNKVVTSFNPKDIYYDTNKSIFNFEKVVDITPYVSDSKEQAILNNISDLATFAFCSYLRGYDPKNGLLHKDVIANEFNKFVGNFNPDDVDYYRSVLVDSHNTKTLPPIVYYSDYVLRKEQEKNGNGMGNNPSLIKATMAGKLMSDETKEAGFGSTFFMVAMTSSMVMATLGLILYVVNTLL